MAASMTERGKSDTTDLGAGKKKILFWLADFRGNTWLHLSSGMNRNENRREDLQDPREDSGQTNS